MVKIIFNTFADGRKILQDRYFESQEDLNDYLENDNNFLEASEKFLSNSYYVDDKGNEVYEDSWLYYTETV